MDDRTLEYVLSHDPAALELFAPRLGRRFKALLDFNVGGVTLEGLQLSSSGPIAITEAKNLSGLQPGDEIQAPTGRLEVRSLNLDPFGRGRIAFKGSSGLPGEEFSTKEDETGALGSIFYSGKKS